MHAPTRQYNLAVPAIIMMILFIPWLGEMFFYSKGEPREAIVAVSMLDSGDWVLPTSYGGDIPYKPPFLAWLIGVASLLLNGGVVNEFTSRLPSALAGVALLVATWRLLVNRVGRDRAWLTIFVLATSFEFYRATVACRVDMVLTACMVGAIYGMYTMKGHPWRVVATILLLSGATLTKGPVGTLLPCLAMGIYFIIRRQNFFAVVARLGGMAIASFILPALWYWAAYRQGGDNFAALAWEENIGRLTGSMGYESHVNPWYYNLVTLVAGMLPWTLTVVAALCVRRVRAAIAAWWHAPKSNLAVMSWTVGLTVLIFYCIPESKRSVYLLPCYPFMALGTAWLLGRVRVPRIMSVWANILAILAIIAPLTIIVLQYIPVGRISVEPFTWYQWLVGIVPIMCGMWWLVTRSQRADGLVGSTVLTFVIMLGYGGAYAPAVMNPRSDIHAVRRIEQIIPADAPIRTYISADSLLRFYSMNFYMGDRLRVDNGCDIIDGKPVWRLTDTLVPEDSARAIVITERSSDTRKPVYLIYPQK